MTLLRKFTVDDFHKMAEVGLFGEDERVELLRGEIHEMTPVGKRHAATVAKLLTLFSTALAGRVVFWNQNPLQLPPHGEPEPDLALLTFSEDHYENTPPQPKDVLLLIEVSDSTLLFDRNVKAPIYAEAGIPEFWIVNLIHDRIEIFQEPQGTTYRTQLSAPFGLPVSPLHFPEVSITL